LARIIEILEIATEKIELVKKQSSTLEEDIRKEKQATISLVSFIKGID
jgi:restriction endonuclease S subunit